MFSIFVDIVKEGLNFFLNQKKDLKEDKLRLSQVLKEISNVLDDTATKFLNDEYPHGNCVIMENLSNELVSKIERFVTKEQSEKLIDCLKDVVFLEKHFTDRKNGDVIPQIQRASGEFKSLSIILSI